MAQAEEIRTETGPLDYDYTEKEVELCQENLQNHKACSPDKIKNEMLKYGGTRICELSVGCPATTYATVVASGTIHARKEEGTSTPTKKQRVTSPRNTKTGKSKRVLKLRAKTVTEIRWVSNLHHPIHLIYVNCNHLNFSKNASLRFHCLAQNARVPCLNVHLF
eukprot:g3812.t1